MRRIADRPASLLLAAVLCAGAASAAPAAAQSTGPSHAGFDPNASMEGHFHEGDLGEKALVLERNLQCSCGCRLDLHSCQFQMQCGVSPCWSQRIRDALAQGQSVETVQAGFVSEFGLTVLMAPPAEGFNLVGYLLPAFAILSAGVLVGLIARGGARRATPAPVAHVTDADAERLREAMRTLDEAESPDW
jgi:cytochrome c-type biogenesis protein CcmH/NrfF